MVNGTQFNNDANSATEFAEDPFVKKDAFFSRLAYATLKHKKWGEISIGKQWGLYYDVAVYTDNFTVFGGESNGVYSGNTDGGWKGTGRADNAIVYRNNFKRWDFGLQTQVLGNNTSTYGAVLSYKTPMGLTLGTAINSAQLNDKNA
jgi:predicted porin